jgi:vacuolar-type H+-ATPase subunit H
MKKKLCVVAMMTTLFIWGCGQEEKKAEIPAPEMTTAVEEAMDTVEEAAGEAKGQVEEAAEQATQAVEETVTPAVEKVRKTVVAATDKARETVAAAADKLTTTTVESVVLDNAYGKIILSHKKHAEIHGCIVCHGDQKPGTLNLGKDAGHALCLGCHKAKSGPTACTQCHQKKAPVSGGY